MSFRLLARLPRLHLPAIFTRRLHPTNKANGSDALTPAALPVHPSRDELINAESSYGRTLFGPIPAGHRREFFHDKNNIWIWHESWADAAGHPQQFTIRYEVRPTGVYKKLGAGQYLQLEGAELENFRRAAHAYLDLVKTNLYHKS